MTRSFATAFQRLYSLAMNAPNSAAVEPLTTTPTVTRRSRTLSSAMMSLSVLFSLATTVPERRADRTRHTTS